MNVKIIKPDCTVFEGEASLVELPGTGGLFQLLNNHAPIISALTEGIIRLDTAQGRQAFEVKAGVVKCQQNEVLILIQ